MGRDNHDTDAGQERRDARQDQGGPVVVGEEDRVGRAASEGAHEPRHGAQVEATAAVQDVDLDPGRAKVVRQRTLLAQADQSRRSRRRGPSPRTSTA